MRVGIDGLHLFGNYAGIKGSLAQLVSALRAQAPSDEICLYVPRNFKGPPRTEGDSGLLVRRTWFPGQWRSVRTLWRNFFLKGRIYADQCDVFHGPTYALPSLLALPAVVTIHDVIALTHPLFCTPGSARIQKISIPRSVQAARRVIVPSAATRRALLQNVQKIQEERIDVIPWGVDPRFAPLPESQRAEARQALKLPERYVLFVGNLEPKKNIPLLLQAFFAARMHLRLPHKLVLAGQHGWGLPNLARLIRELNACEYVCFTGYVPPAALPALYSLADAFAMPSVIEGFGLPVLEAMACGCPVLTSADPALQETGGNAIRVVPHDAKPLQLWREAFEDVLFKNERQRIELSARGIERAKLFRWEQTARATHACYERALEPHF